MALLLLATLPINGTKMERMASFISPSVRQPLGGRTNPNRAAATVRCSSERVFGNAHAGFPAGFAFGAASAAYQVEGATNVDGRGPSIWDYFCEHNRDKILDGRDGEPGAGSYYHHKEDVDRLVELGVNVYRFSISWSRILPDGRTVNPKGIEYYKKLIRELRDKNIEPFVTIFHWDVPQALEEEYNGFLDKHIISDYKYFAKTCFDHFGEEVKHWITLNEPLTFCFLGYGLGSHAPGRCTPPKFEYGGQDYECQAGDSIREPYIVGHNLLLAHAEVVQLYKKEYQPIQGGKIGITLLADWLIPFDNSPQNIEAQKRGNDFNIGWFMDPIKFGDYPFSMKSLVGDRLPAFTSEESTSLIDSFDFVGLNYYTSSYAQNRGFTIDFKPTVYIDDAHINTRTDKDGIPIGYCEADSWVNVYPTGIKDLLLHVKERYSDPDIYITENGVLQNQPEFLSLENEMNDVYRTQYQSVHLHELVEAIRLGVKLKGYFLWSLLDSFEWNFGYTSKFGLYYVNNSLEISREKQDYMPRIPKYSARWYKWFLSIAKAPPPPLVEFKEEDCASIPTGRATPIRGRKKIIDSKSVPTESKTITVST
ncbi:Beta-glucosidase 11 [Apostasia shenzhenica]|uniref:Beta-glucosidase 11 n=1 Tax=Apostasia shenzhenica TaxID=1088818 RepID=A0A2I0AF10_9ASPA|nr:Beta-glucosidase 11 [Apostasia shenzhenica]